MKNLFAIFSMTLASALVSLADAPASLEIYLLAGQSNMAGRGKIQGSDTKPVARVWSLDASGNWIPAKTPLHFDKPSIAGTGLGTEFGRMEAAKNKSLNIGLVPCAFGGTSIDQWAPGKTLFTNAIARTKIAMKSGTLKAILWHQGESDSSESKRALYPAKFQRLAEAFRKELGNVPIAVGELGRYRKEYSEFNEVLPEAVKRVPDCAIVSSYGLTSNPDNVHFDRDSLIIFGRRYFDVVEELVTKPKFVRMKYNNPGLVTDLNVGLWAFPLPLPPDAEGRRDIIVSCPDVPYHGVAYFRNKGSKDAPVYARERELSHNGMHNVAASFVDGKLRVLSPNCEYREVETVGLGKWKWLGAEPLNGVRGNIWRYVDYNGDGKTDIVVGGGFWNEYGWMNAYDANGVWTNGPLHGLVYWMENTGTEEKPVYSQRRQILAGGKPIDVYGNPCPSIVDFDGDGDLDILCGEFLDGFTYFENIGTRTEPVYAEGRRLKDANGIEIKMDLEMINPTALDWDGDGKIDILCGEESGRVALLKNTGKYDENHTPVFSHPEWLKQEADWLKFGALATPFAVDWDGDGDLDLVCGNSAGYIAFIENLSGPGNDTPKWAEPVCLKAGGETIRIMAGVNGSIQGPAEAKWGYTVVSVADWDGDGDLDIVANSIFGDVIWFENTGTRNKPELAKAKPIEVEWAGEQPALNWGWRKPNGKALLTQWRTSPVVFDWNKDGLPDLVMLDTEGYLCLYPRAVKEGKRVLLPPQRVFLRENGEELRLTAGFGGGSGRRKFCICDWDGDGLPDLVCNSVNAEWWKQVKEENGKSFFRHMGNIDTRKLAGHTTCPTAADFDGDGVPDLVVGAEDGYFYYLKNPRSGK